MMRSSFTNGAEIFNKIQIFERFFQPLFFGDFNVEMPRYLFRWFFHSIDSKATIPLYHRCITPMAKITQGVNMATGQTV